MSRYLLYVVFSEQGTSANHLVATKLFVASARLPGNYGEDSGGAGAYTKVELGGEDTDSPSIRSTQFVN